MTTDKSKNFFRVSAEDFKKIPGSPIAYWAEKLTNCFANNKKFENLAIIRSGLSTGDNDRFMRYWYEVDCSEIAFNFANNQEFEKSAKQYVPCKKGGDFRRWYGDNEYIIKWRLSALFHRPRTTYIDLYYRPAISWSAITSGKFHCRYYGKGFLFDHAAASLFPHNANEMMKYLAYMSTKVFNYALETINPTINTGADVVGRLPVCDSVSDFAGSNAEKCVKSSKNNWDSYETSWDFQSNPLIVEYNRGKWVKQTPIWSIYDSVRRKWAEDCEKMRQLEMSNNRIFIDAYGLQEELTSDVPWDEITLTCNPWYRYGKTLDKSSTSIISHISAVTGEKSQLQVIDNVYSICECSSNGIATTEAYPALSANFPYNKELEDRLLSDTIKEFISYAVGCMMGRYSPEKSGLILANQSNGQEEDLIIYETTVTGSNIFSQDPSTVSFSAKDGQQQLMSSYTSFFPVIGDNKHLIIDRDGVLPILDEEWFFDDIVTRFKNFVAFIFGKENLTANMDFIESVLGKDIRKYFVKDFYKEHIQRYKKRPIYWLFSSPKGSFNALIYLHRYTPDTVSIVLNEYLRELMTKLSTRIKHLIEENNRADISNADKTRNLKQIDKYTAQLAELEDYERDVIFPLAQQKIAIDLDDGVKVNYCKFGAALKKIPGLEAKEE